MAINKPVGPKDKPNRISVGGNYADRCRYLNTANISSETSSANRSKDPFGARKTDLSPDFFSSNAQYIGTRNVLPHNKLKVMVESGKGTRLKTTTATEPVNDNVRLLICDKIIAIYGDNKPPAPIKNINKISK